MKKLLLVLTLWAFCNSTAHAQMKIESFTITPNQACRGDIVTLDFKTSGLVTHAYLLGKEKEPILIYVTDSVGRIYVRASLSATYHLTVYDALGGAYTDTASLTVVPCPTTVPEIAQPVSHTFVYPNPCTDQCTITRKGTFTAQLYDAKGSVLFTEMATDMTLFDLSDIPAGLYFVSVSSEGNREIVKIVKSN